MFEQCSKNLVTQVVTITTSTHQHITGQSMNKGCHRVKHGNKGQPAKKQENNGHPGLDATNNTPCGTHDPMCRKTLGHQVELIWPTSSTSWISTRPGQLWNSLKSSCILSIWRNGLSLWINSRSGVQSLNELMIGIEFCGSQDHGWCEWVPSHIYSL